MSIQVAIIKVKTLRLQPFENPMLIVTAPVPKTPTNLANTEHSGTLHWTTKARIG